MITNFPNGIQAFPVIGGNLVDFFGNDNTFFVDGDLGSDGQDGKSPVTAKRTIQGAVDAANANSTIYVKVLKVTAGSTDPASYTENIVIPVAKSGLKIIGVSINRTQGGLPQLKVGTTTTQALITVRAPNCTIANMGINGAGATGGGILLDDDSSTKVACGTAIVDCHFKNCKGTTATNAATGGAIQWASTGGAWQVLIKGNRFYKNVGDVVVLGTSVSRPQDVIIEDNVFSGPAASVDCNLFLKGGGSGIDGVVINRNVFPCFPAIGTGTNVKPMDLTGCVGSLSNNTFGCTGKTFGAAANVLVPTTVLMANNYQEDGATQIART